MKMNLLGATSAASYHGHASPPPSRASSSSFVLSPHAPPFRLDRPKTQPPTPAPSSASFSSVPGGKASIQSLSSYQPCYESTVDDGVDLERTEVLSGVGAGASLFGQSSSYDPFPFQKDIPEGTYGGFAAYGDDTANVWFGEHVNPFPKKAPSELGCSGWPYNRQQLIYEENVAPKYENNFGSSCLVGSTSSTTPYTYFPESISVGIPVRSSKKSLDNECVVQHDSCLVTPIAFYSSTSSPTQTQTTQLSPCTYSPADKSTLVYESSGFHHEDMGTVSKNLPAEESCLVTPIGFYSSITSPIQTLNTQLSPGTHSPADKSTSIYESSRLHHEDMGAVSKNLSAKTRDPSVQITIEGKEGYCDKRRVNRLTDKCRGSYSLKKGSLSADELGTGSSMDPFGIEEPSLSRSANSESNPSPSNILMQVPPETMDQDNLAEDSPCWKGVSAFKHTLPSKHELINFPNVMMESKNCCNLDKVQGHLPLGLGCPATHDEDGRRVYAANGEDSSFLRGPIAVGLPKTPQKSILINGRSIDVENQNRKWIQNSERFKEQIRETSNVCERDSQANDDVRMCLEAGAFAANHARIQDETAKLKGCVNTAVQDHSSDPDICAKETFMNLPGEVIEPLGSCSVSEKCPQSGDVQILIKAMHNLSRVLLSSNFTNGYDMEENDFELLQKVISNLQAFSRNKGKGAVPPIAMVDDGKPSDGGSTHALKLEMPSANPIENSDKSVDYAARSSDKNFMSQDKAISEAFERVLDKSPNQLKESPPWLLYKNLWIEAEAALCSMKCELQAARMEIMLNNQKHHMKGDSHDQLESLSDPSQTMKPVVPPLTGDDAVKSKCSESHEPLIPNANKGDNVDDSVMSRFSGLKGWIEKTNSSFFEQQGTKETMRNPFSSSSTNNTGLESLQVKLNAFDVFNNRPRNEIMKEVSDAPLVCRNTTIASLTAADRPIVRISAPKAKEKHRSFGSNSVSQRGSWIDNQTELPNLKVTKGEGLLFQFGHRN